MHKFILFHSSLDKLSLKEIKYLYDSLLEKHSKDTLVFPTFNFNFCHDKVYDFEKTPSQMGLLTELARRDKRCVRTFHPVYSFSGIGPHADELEKISNISSYGDDSFFGFLKRENGEIQLLNINYQRSMTFFHYIEQMTSCNYRYHKFFSGQVIDKHNIKKKYTISIFVRNLEKNVVTTVEPMGIELEKMGLVKNGYFLNLPLKILNAAEVYKACFKLPHQNPELFRTIG